MQPDQLFVSSRGDGLLGSFPLALLLVLLEGEAVELLEVPEAVVHLVEALGDVQDLGGGLHHGVEPHAQELQPLADLGVGVEACVALLDGLEGHVEAGHGDGGVVVGGHDLHLEQHHLRQVQAHLGQVVEELLVDALLDAGHDCVRP